MAVARAAHLHVDQRVKITVEMGRVVIRSLEEPTLTIEQRLARFNPAKHGGEAMASEHFGAEK